MGVLICGSVAYDHIMVFPDQFKNYILPDKVHMINVSFLVPDMRREFGGCAGNIAYNLNLLDESLAFPMATVGKDFAPYACWMDKKGINRSYITIVEQVFTGQAFITTDLNDNQITAFHPGAMNFSHNNHVSDANDIKLGIVSPDGRDGMIQHAEQFVDAGIPFVFDPSQGLPMFNSDDLKKFIEQASWVTVNDYEWEMMQEKTGLSAHEISGQVAALIITRGEQGSYIYTKDKRYDIPSVKSKMINDPTGCGDAYRAGLLYGLVNEFDWQTIGRIASLMGSIKVAQYGTQNHSFTLDEFKTLFKENFKYSF